MIRALIALACLAAVACSTKIIVHDKAGSAVSQADVYVGDARAGATDAAGTLTVSMTGGLPVFARKLMYEHASYRGNHGPGQGWVMRAYQTSLAVQNDGSRTGAALAAAPATQAIALDPQNGLIGLHLVVSLEWDASQAELDELAARFGKASEYLYNLTDGQFLLEQVELGDDGQLWGSAEIVLVADNITRPFTSYPGGYLGPVAFSAPVIKMAPFSDNPYASREAETIIHELGHLAFGLQDEYIGFGDGPHFCTQNLLGKPGAAFAPGGVQASCAMNHQMLASKLCSNQAGNPHHGGTYQFGSCWDTIRNGAFNDPGGGTARWTFQTPDTRGAIPGHLPPIPAGLRTVVNVMNRKLHDLCAPFKFTHPNGASAAGNTVSLIPSFWGPAFWEGALDYQGAIELRGVHLGDVIQTPGATVTVGASQCAPTE